MESSQPGTTDDVTSFELPIMEEAEQLVGISNDFDELPLFATEDDGFNYCCLCSLPQFGAKTEIQTRPIVKKRKRSTNKKEGEGPKQRPNFFLAARVSNPETKRRIEEVQEAIVGQHSQLRHTTVDTRTLHLTLAVMNLSTEDDFARARSALDASRQRLGQTQPWPNLQFHGLGHFQNQVLFVKVRQGPSLERLLSVAEVARDCLRSVGLLVQDDQKFQAHLTVMKLSKAPQLRRQGIKKIDRMLYEEFEDLAFGEEPLSSLQLLSMEAEKEEDGYYHCQYEVRLDKDQ